MQSPNPGAPNIEGNRRISSSSRFQIRAEMWTGCVFLVPWILKEPHLNGLHVWELAVACVRNCNALPTHSLRNGAVLIPKDRNQKG